MASKRLSPTAKLLRHSKLFSLPPRIPSPASSQTSGRLITFNSETATLPHPISAAIETSPLTIGTGDWGLKRPMPIAQTTSTSTPVIRINAVDSLDHVTWYESAADHVLTLQKWQEMHIPIMMESGESGALARRLLSSAQSSTSVFEENLQTTATGVDEVAASDASRWKFDGPWLAGLSAGEFENYLKKEVKKRRPYFQAFARKWLLKQKAANVKREALAKGEVAEVTQVEFSDEEYNTSISRLRHEKDDLWTMIWQFLDLPGRPPLTGFHSSSFEREIDRWTSDVDQGPPATHPSAGLSYLRTAAHVANHPQLGPVRSQPPIQGRVLRSGANATRAAKELLVGVGGVVASRDSGAWRLGDGFNPNEIKFDPELEGGSKVWVQPKQASIDPRGKIRLIVDKAGNDDLAVWENKVDGGDSSAASQPDYRMSIESRRKAYNKLFKR